MIRIKPILLLLLFSVVIQLNNLYAEGLELNLTDSAKLTVLNSRFGSRFTCSIATADKAIRTGSLGFDMDEMSDLYIGFQNEKENYCFPTCNKPVADKYFPDQSLSFDLNHTVIKGSTTNNLAVQASIVSPFTCSSDLNDTKNIKTQIAPAFYLLVETTNNSTHEISGNIKIGFRDIPVNSNNQLAVRSYRANRNQMFFRDNAGINSKRTIKGNKSFNSYFNQHGFSGLEKQVKLSPGQSTTDTLIYATYFNGKVLRDLRTNQDLHFYYTQYWKSLQEVVEYAEQNAAKNIKLTQDFEEIVNRSGATPKEKWMVALAFHNDLANTFFLIDEKQQPRFYLVEGRFQHLSTIDVAHETELMAMFAPWRLRLQLEQWTHYLATGEVSVAPNPVLGKGEYTKGLTAAEYGPFLYHDVGDVPFVDATSNYNFGPNMAVEENADFVLLLYWYWKLTGDDAFVKSKLGLTDILLQSLINRDTDNSGIADTGYGWSTYDVNKVLKFSPENTYLGVKELCAYVTAAEMFGNLANKGTDKGLFLDKEQVFDGDGVGFNSATVVSNGELRKKQALKYQAEAEKIFQTIRKAIRKHGYLPICLDSNFKGWDQQSITIGEGLFLPGLSGCESALLKKLSVILAKEYKTAYKNSQTSYGIKLVSKEAPTWFSKTMVSDIVASYWYGIDNSTASYAYQWNKNHPFAYNDGVLYEGFDWIGYWYPRGISALPYLFREQKLTGIDLLNFAK